MPDKESVTCSGIVGIGGPTRQFCNLMASRVIRQGSYRRLDVTSLLLGTRDLTEAREFGSLNLSSRNLDRLSPAAL
jgi:hypothetical protein